MTITMNDSHMVSIAQVKEFLKVARGVEFKGSSKKEKYQWIEAVLLRFRYYSLRKKEKSILKNYIMKMTGYSDAQITRLIERKRKWGKIIEKTGKRHAFSRVYTPDDLALLIETDNAHRRLSGPATKEIFKRAFLVFKKKEFSKMKNISVSHIYNLRQTRNYQSRVKIYIPTKSVQVKIGERLKPDPQGKPGYIRVDTVHQGDREKEKGVYHINCVDSVTQWEIVGAVEQISEYYLEPLLEDLIAQYPFRIFGFHSDNGSEFINKIVAKLLNKLLIKQTKSRTRHCNDNALAESKNGSVIRKHMGYHHIARKHAAVINQFDKEYFNVYLNYHRPCGFATIFTDNKGKQKKKYETYLTPYDKFRSLKNPKQYLKKGVTLKSLDTIAQEKSDNEFAALMEKTKDTLFKNF